MLEKQQALLLNSCLALCDLRLRKIHELVDLSFVEQEFWDHYCLDNDRNATPPVGCTYISF